MYKSKIKLTLDHSQNRNPSTRFKFIKEFSLLPDRAKGLLPKERNSLLVLQVSVVKSNKKVA